MKTIGKIIGFISIIPIAILFIASEYIICKIIGTLALIGIAIGICKQFA